MKEGDFVFIESTIYNEGQRDENYTTYTGIISYVSENNVGFQKCVRHIIYTKLGKTYTTKPDSFSVPKERLKL